MNTLILRLDCLQDFLKYSQDLRHALVEELIDNATDPIIRMRRFRMLHDLSRYEADTISKIMDFDANLLDWESSMQHARSGLAAVINRAS